MKVAFVAIAGAAGALCRYGVGAAIGVRSFPWTTLGINLLGSFLLGVVLTFGADRWSQTATTAVAVGFLGAFTTFSTFSYETQTLLRAHRPAAALSYVLLSVLIGIAAAALGYAVGQRITA